MRLGTKILLLTLAITLGLDGIVILVVTVQITDHEIVRSRQIIQEAFANYAYRVNP